MKISIITVVYNGVETLEETILSVINQPYDLDYIIIDGGSNDGTTDIIKRYQQSLKYWVSEPDKGIYDAMNKGWSLADNESYILFIGSGDKILSLPKIYDKQNYDVIYGDVVLDGRGIFRSKVNWKLKIGNTIHHQALLVKKSIHLTPPFSLMFKTYSDFDFNQRLYKAKAKFIKDTHFKSSASRGGVSERFNAIESSKVVKKNFGPMFGIFAKIYYILQNARRAK